MLFQTNKAKNTTMIERQYGLNEKSTEWELTGYIT